MSDASANTRRHRYFKLKEPGASDRILILDTQELTIGRANESDLKAKYADVSRRHAVIKREGQAFSVQNMSTSSKTSVNGNAAQTHTLKDQDVIRIGELEITFVESAANPATVGPRLEYASQLKDFAPGAMQGSNPEATILGVAHAEKENETQGFAVGRAGDFGYGLGALDEQSSEPRDLDLELDGFGLHESPEPVVMTPEALAPSAKPAPKQPPAREKSLAEKHRALEMPVAAKPPPIAKKAATPTDAWTLDDSDSEPNPSASTLSLNLEIEGLTPDLRKAVGSLIGKIISLPSLKIRLKGSDLDG